jgi:hypothetical protein
VVHNFWESTKLTSIANAPKGTEYQEEAQQREKFTDELQLKVLTNLYILIY